MRSATSRGPGRGPGGIRSDPGALLALVEEGIVDGLRIDHVDGLRDPKAYLQASARRAAAVLATGREDPGAGRDGARGLGRRRDDRLRGRQPPRRASDRSRRRGRCSRGPTRTSPGGTRRRRSGARGEARGAGADARVGTRGARPAAPAARCATPISGARALRVALVETVAALDVYRTYADEDGMASERPPARRRRGRRRRASGGRTSIPTPSRFCSAR